jgi:tetratricopeptide (TPR) repeat protein
MQNTVNPQQALEAALVHQQAGRLAEAEALCREVLAAQPNHPDALHRLGVLAFHAGQSDAAMELIGKAIAANGNSATYYADLGNLLLTCGRGDEAITAFQRSLRLQPNLPEAHSGMGNVLQIARRFPEAIAAYRDALNLRQDLPLVWNNMGNALREVKDFGEAEKALRRALQLRPNFPAAYYNLSLVLHQANRLNEAIDAARKAVSLNPNYPDAWNQLGISLDKSGQTHEAISALRQAITGRPNFAEAHSNLGKSLRSAGAIDQAISAYRQALSIRPDLPQTHFNLGAALLLTGQFQPGWQEFEFRRQIQEFRPYLLEFPQPKWDGAPLDGKRILLHTEQGFGDAIQFVRYVPQVIARGGQVILHCQTELVRLFQSVEGVQQVVERGQMLPKFDVHCPLLSLPTIFDTSIQTIPATVPYLHPEAALVDEWRSRLPEKPGVVRVGLAWAGRTEHPNDRNRSMPLAGLALLGKVPGVWLCSVQKSETGQNGSDWTRELRDFAETAALIENLDLVITVDTAVAHLAGAMGKPVWVLLPFVPDWRWLLGREDSPWYPTMRLFRQRAAGDWTGPVAAAAEALAKFQPSRR